MPATRPKRAMNDQVGRQANLRRPAFDPEQARRAADYERFALEAFRALQEAEPDPVTEAERLCCVDDTVAPAEQTIPQDKMVAGLLEGWRRHSGGR